MITIGRNSALRAGPRSAGSGVVKQTTARWSNVVDLKRGTYRLRVAQFPSWYCLVEVE
jgi:hypothetical protein